MSGETINRVRKAERELVERLRSNPKSTLTDKEKRELLNLRKRIVTQRDEIKRLQEQVKHLREQIEERGENP
jgi:uncharacterized coiled-coil protein SlyX